jgi:hypothetical protein
MGLAIVSLLLGPLPAEAQPPQPTINYVFPAGGQRGKAIEVTVVGKDFQGTNAVRLSGAGVTAGVVKVENPNTVHILVAIAADAPLGERDVRLATRGGISNRFRFFVGELPEINEIEPNSEKDKPQRLESLPVVVNGQILDGDRDFFRFSAKAGQTFVCEVQGRKIVPYISDAVPGWLDACLTLYDASGKQLAFVNDFRFDPDPLLSFSIPKDGEYTLEVRDILYRGRPEFVYRLTLGVFPYITHVFPLGGQRNTPVALELHGINLSTNFLVPGDSPAVRTVGLGSSQPALNVLPFAVGDTPEVREAEPNDTPAQANRVTTPVTINGRIGWAGDADHFIFTAQAGQVLAMEVLARRLGSPLDSILTLFNAKGDELAENDDAVDPFDALITHHADSRLVYTFPAAGDYVLRIKDVQGKGGEEYAYRLVIAPPQPEFALRITPDTGRLGPGESIVVPVAAVRRDFGGEIALSAQNLPPGFVLSDGVIPAGQDQARLTITAPADAQPGTVVAPLIVGTATIGNAPVVRQATGAESVMQAFSLTHIVPTKEFVVAVLRAPTFTLSLGIPPKEIQVHQGSNVPVVVKVARRENIKGAVSLEAVAPPAGVTIKPETIAADKGEVTITLNVSKQAPLGLRQTVIINGTLKTDKEMTTRTAPALPIKIIGP